LPIVLLRADAESDIPGRIRNWTFVAAKKNCALEAAILPQTKEQMFLFQNRRRRHRLHVASQKKWLGIGLAKRLKQIVPAKQFPAEIA
jgi:hypothetical protein